ncbi:hypothetical protein H312_01756 [Anncaliia algerae PRA339]|uniref:AAA+ ATPase domain-containing protein n=1 Tax=Anncaliia algerae PRA339 TaxID=1288291 RepID=A0A059F0V9_9MICR|nr:hypothetical protein H312_01756 [Anncaliia algerae PRA339]
MTINQRESQSKEIEGIINRFRNTGNSLITYICGPPGSGKTYTLTQILNDTFPSYFYINCSKLKVKSNIYSKLIGSLKKKGKGYDDLKNILQKEKKKFVIVLDEIDLLVTKKQSILYNLFELPYLKGVSLLLFTIANTMNLSEISFENKVKSRMGSRRINFNAYTFDELMLITKSNKELALAAKRVSALGGDCRKMKEIKDKIIRKYGEKPTIYQVDSLYNELYKPIYYSFFRSLTNHQKLIIFSLFIIRKSSLNNLFNNLISFCIRLKLRQINYFEFNELIRISSEQRIIEIKREVIYLMWNEEEVKRALLEDEIYKQIFVI